MFLFRVAVLLFWAGIWMPKQVIVESTIAYGSQVADYLIAGYNFTIFGFGDC